MLNQKLLEWVRSYYANSLAYWESKKRIGEDFHAAYAFCSFQHGHEHQGFSKSQVWMGYHFFFILLFVHGTAVFDASSTDLNHNANKHETKGSNRKSQRCLTTPDKRTFIPCNILCAKSDDFAHLNWLGSNPQQKKKRFCFGVLCTLLLAYVKRWATQCSIWN